MTLGSSSVFDGVVALYNSSGDACTGALISSTAILTARHCTDGLVDTEWGVYFGSASTGFEQLGVTGVTSLGGGVGGVSNYLDGSDLAILSLSSAVTDIEPFEILTEPEYAETMAIVGYGDYGTGETGDINPIDWERRYATNTYELAENNASGNPILFADFDKEDGTENTLADLGYESTAEGTEYEGLIGSGDSGGPALFWRDGQWVIGGVATAIRSYDGDPNSDFGDLGIWTAIQSDEAIDFVTSFGATIYSASEITPVPLPASIQMLSVAVLGVLGMAARTRRRRPLRAGMKGLNCPGT